MAPKLGRLSYSYCKALLNFWIELRSARPSGLPVTSPPPWPVCHSGQVGIVETRLERIKEGGGSVPNHRPAYRVRTH
jgi:hypothetical protein